VDLRTEQIDQATDYKESGRPGNSRGEEKNYKIDPEGTGRNREDFVRNRGKTCDPHHPGIIERVKLPYIFILVCQPIKSDNGVAHSRHELPSDEIAKTATQ